MFVRGHEYIRSELHRVYGGQQQGGISTPRSSPYIFLFTGESGAQYGYVDEWEEGVFLYTGEGQVGDMEFVRGNKAVRDHLSDGKDMHLFEEVGGGRKRYEIPTVAIVRERLTPSAKRSSIALRFATALPLTNLQYRGVSPSVPTQNNGLNVRADSFVPRPSLTTRVCSAGIYSLHSGAFRWPP